MHPVLFVPKKEGRWCGASSASQLRLKLRCRFLGWSGECAQTYRICTQLDNGHSHNHRIKEGVKTEVRRHTRTQLSCKRQVSPTAIDYRSGERGKITMKPQTKCARSQGTTSPQISVTFRRFSYQPIIWHRGPRPRAHWYMCADAANSQNYHNPLSMSDVLITQTFSSWGLSSRRYFCSCPG